MLGGRPGPQLTVEGQGQYLLTLEEVQGSVKWQGAASSTRLWCQVESLIHESEQLLPTSEVEVACQRSQVVEEGAPDRQFAAYSLIHLTTEVQNTVEEEGQYQEGQ